MRVISLFLPSFPTRRSSDLALVIPHPTIARVLDPLLVEGRIPRGWMRPSTSNGSSTRDRKSTRLNSSHDSTSHAVSRYIKKMKRAGLIEGEKRGQFIYYSIN